MAGVPYQFAKPGAFVPQKPSAQPPKVGATFIPSKPSIPCKPGGQPVPAFVPKGGPIPMPKVGAFVPPVPVVNPEFKAGPPAGFVPGPPVKKAGIPPAVNEAECQKLKSEIEEMRVALDNERAKKATELYKSLVPRQEKADFDGGCGQAIAVVQAAKEKIDASWYQTMAVAEQLQQERQTPLPGSTAQGSGDSAQELKEMQAEAEAVVAELSSAIESDMQTHSATLQGCADQIVGIIPQAWEYLQSVMTQMNASLPQVKAKLGKA